LKKNASKKGKREKNPSSFKNPEKRHREKQTVSERRVRHNRSLDVGREIREHSKEKHVKRSFQSAANGYRSSKMIREGGRANYGGLVFPKLRKERKSRLLFAIS